MSAHVPSKTHIDLMVRAMIHGGSGPDRFRWWRVDDDGGYAGWKEIDEFAERRQDTDHLWFVTPSQAGQVLVSEVVFSVHHRYPDTDPDEGNLPGPLDAYYIAPYLYENPGYTLNPGEVFHAIDYYEYQACEHDTWHRSEAWRLCLALRKAYCNKVPGASDSPWGWEADDLEVKPREFSVRII